MKRTPRQELIIKEILKYQKKMALAPSLAELAELTGLDQSTVSRELRILKEVKEIRRVQSGQRAPWVVRDRLGAPAHGVKR